MGLDLKESTPASRKYDETAIEILKNYGKMIKERRQAIDDAYDQLSTEHLKEWMASVRKIIESDERDAFYVCEDTPEEEAILYALREQIAGVLNKDSESLYPRDFMAEGEFLGSEAMFVTDFQAFTFDGREYVIEYIYGQGESAARVICPSLRTDRYDDDDANYKAITRYPKISFDSPGEDEQPAVSEPQAKPDLSIEGILSRNDGKPLTLDDFIAIVEANDLSFGGFTKPIDVNAD